MLNFVSVSALSAFEAVVSAKGFDPATANLSVAERARIAAVVSRAVGKAWRLAAWPQLLVCKRVAFRQTWDPLDEYEADDEVFWFDAYWRCLENNTVAVEPGADTLAWVRCESDMLYSINYAEHGIDEMSLVSGCFASNPERVRDPKPMQLVRIGTGAAVVSNLTAVPPKVWIKYRPFPPKYSWEMWAGGTDYTTGDIIMHDGDCWSAQASSTGVQPGTDEAYWAPMPMPEMFMDFVEDFYVAQAMSDDDGKAKEMARAERTLLETYDDFAAQMTPRRRMGVRVC